MTLHVTLYFKSSSPMSVTCEPENLSKTLNYYMEQCFGYTVMKIEPHGSVKQLKLKKETAELQSE